MLFLCLAPLQSLRMIFKTVAEIPLQHQSLEGGGCHGCKGDMEPVGRNREKGRSPVPGEQGCCGGRFHLDCAGQPLSRRRLSPFPTLFPKSLFSPQSRSIGLGQGEERDGSFCVHLCSTARFQGCVPNILPPFHMVFYHDCTCWTDGCTLPHNLEIHSEYLNHIIPRRMKSEYRTHAHTISRRDRQAAEKHAPYTDIFATIPLCLSSLPPSCSSSRR